MYCPKCGKELVGEAKFCASCGAAVDVKSNQNDISPLKQKKVSDGYDFLDSDEKIIMEGSANKYQTLLSDVANSLNISSPVIDKIPVLGMSKGGKLILTDKRIVFLAHALNLGSKYEEIPLSQVSVSGNTLNIFCPTPSMIKVVTLDGKTHQFVVTGKQKDEWKEKILEYAKNYKPQ